jgi:hypothetical protein
MTQVQQRQQATQISNRKLLLPIISEGYASTKFQGMYIYLSHRNKSKSQLTSPTPAQLPAVAVSSGHIICICLNVYFLQFPKIGGRKREPTSEKTTKTAVEIKANVIEQAQVEEITKPTTTQ